MPEKKPQPSDKPKPPAHPTGQVIYDRAPRPLPNYTLSTVCPACSSPTYKLACKVRCSKCGFMWDCSEL